MKKVVLAFAMLLAAFALAACGGGDDDTTGAETSAPAETQAEQPADAGGTSEAAKALKFEADPNGELAYTQKDVSWGPGEVTVEFNNPSSVPHNVAIESADGENVVETEVITESSESTTADLKPGTYAFYCSVAGHREAGMEGTLTVK